MGTRFGVHAAEATGADGPWGETVLVLEEHVTRGWGGTVEADGWRDVLLHRECSTWGALATAARKSFAADRQRREEAETPAQQAAGGAAAGKEAGGAGESEAEAGESDAPVEEWFAGARLEQPDEDLRTLWQVEAHHGVGWRLVSQWDVPAALWG